MIFQDVIDILLKKKAELRAEIEREFAARSNKIDELLTLAGYEEPVPEVEEPVNVENGDAIGATGYEPEETTEPGIE